MIGEQSIGGPKDPPRNIGIKARGRVNRDTLNGRTGNLQGIKARETNKLEGDEETMEVQLKNIVRILKKLNAGFIDSEIL